MADSLSILRIATDLYPEVVGGAAIHAHRMSKMQAEMGHDVTMLTSDHGNRSVPRYEERDGYTVRYYREVANPFGNSITPGMVRDIYRLARTHDVVHAHSYLYFSSNVAAAVSRVGGGPFVLTNHGLVSQSAPGALQRIYTPTVGKFTFNAADCVFCYTTVDRDELRSLGVTAPTAVVHNGVDCDLFVPTAGGERRDQILFVGRLKESKGPHRLVEAFAGLADDFPETTLKIVGDGPLRFRLERLVAEHGVGDRVDFAGRVPNESLPAIYAESAVFALPSAAEGLPRSILEALACETPVVTSDLPQMASLMDGVGRTVPPTATGALERALRELLEDPARRRDLGERGRERVVENYSWAETVRRTTAKYYELL